MNHLQEECIDVSYHWDVSPVYTNMLLCAEVTLMYAEYLVQVYFIHVFDDVDIVL